MNRRFSNHTPQDSLLKQKLLKWASGFEVCCVLDSFDYDLPFHTHDLIIGAGVSAIFDPGNDLIASLSDFDAKTNDWIFGHIGYDALSQTKKKSNGSDFQPSFLFIPDIVIKLKGNNLSIGVLNQDPDNILKTILDTPLSQKKMYNAEMKHRVNREDYIKTVQELQNHIRRGDCYEINYCQEFYTELQNADPVDLYQQLTTISPNPFSVFYKVYDQYALCASPERYIKKTGDKLISQPIKGTIARDLANTLQDAKNRETLQESEKDKRENVIVVDLVRNDLSRVCEPGSVIVEELFGVYTFPSVYQMISTIAGNLPPGTDFAKVLEASFPMGSMTGAPKKKVMELIEKYEPINRGLYSGTIGYIDPEKNYDFNVVIRTIFYNRQTGYLSYLAGAGITDLSNPEQEYEECLLKASALNKLLSD